MPIDSHLVSGYFPIFIHTLVEIRIISTQCKSYCCSGIKVYVPIIGAKYIHIGAIMRAKVILPPHSFCQGFLFVHPHRLIRRNDVLY